MGAKKYNHFDGDLYITRMGSFSKKEIEEYYKTHNRNETANYFGVNDRYMKLLLKVMGIIKSKEDVKSQIESGFLKRYDVKRPFCSKEIQDKIKENNKNKYGVENNFQREDIKEKIKKTCLEKYGAEYYSQSLDYHNKVNYDSMVKKNKETQFNKYGCWYNQTLMAAKTRNHFYSYDNEKFDSLPELALWVYAKDHNEEIEREPVRLEYKIDNKIYYYLPDFRYNGELIEIKGDHFFDNEGKLICPYGNNRDNIELNKKLLAKQKCMIDNNVKIFKKLEYQKYVDYYLNKIKE